MPVLIATADGNLTAAATWGTVDATALLDSEAANTALTTAYVESQAFTPGAITVDGIAVKVATRAATPGANTISVRLAQGGALVAGTEVTINVSDIDAATVAGRLGWYFFKFAAPVALAAATPYTLSAKTSAVSMVNLYRNATAGNWSRMLRTTTTAAPGAGDDMFILGEWTAAATKTDRTVTMNSTAATDYGSGSTTLAGLGVGKGGFLTWGTTAATNYILRLSTLLLVWRGGVLNMGTTGTPCPRDSSQQLEFDCAADGDFGLLVHGTFSGQGLSRTSGKNVVQCLLNTDEAAAQTVLGVDTDTGWKSGDAVALAGTTRAAGANDGEERVLAGDAGASSITVTVGLTAAHSGTSPTQAEVVLLTRPVRVLSVSTTAMAYVYFGPTGIVDCDWVEFRYLGSTTTAKRGIEIDTGADGAVALSFCSVRDFDRHGIYTAAADWDNLTIDNLTSFGVGHKSTNDAILRISSTTGSGNWSLSSLTLIGSSASQGVGVFFADLKGSVSNVRISGGGGTCITIDSSDDGMPAAWSGFELHSCAQEGLKVSNIGWGRLNDVNVWRCAGSAGSLTGVKVAIVHGWFTIDGGSIFGNAVANLGNGTSAADAMRATFRNLVIAGDTTFSSPIGFRFGAGSTGYVQLRARFENCTFGVVAGIFAAHTTADFSFSTSTTQNLAEVILNNTLLASATELANDTDLMGDSVIRYQRVDQTTGVHKSYYPALGTITRDTVLFRTATPSEKLEPTNANAKLSSSVKRVAVASSGTVTISCYVQKNASYNGNAPRLILKANPALGIDDDTVIDTLTVGSGTWENLAGVTAAAEEAGVFEFYVDCDGTAGQINVDDWAAA